LPLLSTPRQPPPPSPSSAPRQLPPQPLAPVQPPFAPLPSSALVVTVRATVLSVLLTLATPNDAFMPSAQTDFKNRTAVSASCFMPICYVQLYVFNGSVAAQLIYPTTTGSSNDPLAEPIDATASAASLALATNFFETSDAASLSSALGQQIQAVAPTTVQLDQERSLVITPADAPQTSATGGGGGSPSWLVAIACVVAIVLIALGTVIALKSYRRRRLEAAPLVTEHTGKEAEDAHVGKAGRTELVAVADDKKLTSRI
jgi:hypothetical protein